MTHKKILEMIEAYDSRADTLQHIHDVRDNINTFVTEMLRRGAVHDQSKLMPEEKDAFDRETPMLKNLDFGSDEYKESLKRLGVALDHHYEHNSHHPEHYGTQGIDGMDLFDLVEMYCDWKASALRNKSKGVMNLAYCQERFKMSDQLYNIFCNTMERGFKNPAIAHERGEG